MKKFDLEGKLFCIDSIKKSAVIEKINGIMEYDVLVFGLFLNATETLNFQIMKHLLLLILPFLLFACNNETDTIGNQLILCQCIENPELKDSVPTTKVKYIFLVKGKKGEVDCCNDPLAGEYPAFKEKWMKIPAWLYWTWSFRRKKERNRYL